MKTAFEKKWRLAGTEPTCALFLKRLAIMLIHEFDVTSGHCECIREFQMTGSR